MIREVEMDERRPLHDDAELELEDLKQGTARRTP
jgi:hypothetical protein